MTLIGSTNKTTLSGERGDMGDNTDNVKGIVRIDGPSSGSAVGANLNGLTISGGYGGAVGAFGGAGVFAPSDAILNISHCLFENNTGASSGFFSPGNGGAIYMFKGTIANTQFTGNTSASDGGALYKGSGISNDLTITECIFMSNTARVDGGAVYLGGGTSTLSGSTFISNMATDDGGAIYADGGTNEIDRTIFRDNMATDIGGATFLKGTSDVSNSLFLNNIGTDLAGAIYMDATGLISHCTFTGNQGNIRGAGAVWAHTGANATIANSIFYGNTIMAGVGTQISRAPRSRGKHGTLALTHNIIEDESGTGVSGSPTIINSVSASSLDAIFDNTTMSSSPIYFRLKSSSPALNSGNNDYLDGDADVYMTGDETGALDLAGNPRLFGSTADLGAYEYQRTPPPPLPTTPTVRRVVASPTGATQDGTSWANAMSLQAALTVSVARDTIWVAGGSYVPSKLQDGSDPSTGDERDVTFVIPDGVSICGGFAGTESNMAERDMTLIGSTNKTTLSGERGDMGDNTDNVKGIVRIDGPSSGSAVGTSLNGLTISGGYGGAVGSHRDNDGAGIYVLGNAQLAVSHCIFTNNRVVGLGATGGAVSIVSGGVASITQSVFTNNVSMGGFSSGGAIYARGRVTVTHSTFTNNKAPSGGALYAGSDGEVVLANSIVFTNIPIDAQLRQFGTGVLTLSHNLIEGGSSGVSGSVTMNNTITASSIHELFSSRRPEHPSYLQLKAGSPAVDAGNNDYMDGDPDAYVTGEESSLTDLAGNSRLVGVVVDIGAYEYDHTNAPDIDDYEGIIRVKPTASSNGDGSSWANATTLHDALKRSIAGDTIWVSKGVYKPTELQNGRTPAGDERNAIFFVPHSIALYGGFSGMETRFTERNINMLSANETTLSGDIGVEGMNGDNIRSIVTIEGVAVLDGFTIKDGNGGTPVGVLNAVTYVGGAGISVSNGRHIEINHCTFMDNHVMQSTSVGGAIYLDGTGIISNSVFTNNRAVGGDAMTSGFGGAIYIGAAGSIAITQSVFTNNSIGATGSNGSGGGVYLLGTGIITQSDFINNSASSGGGLFIERAGTGTIANSIFFGNTATGAGSQIAKIGSGNITVTHNLVEDGVMGISEGTPGTLIPDNIITATSLESIFANASDPSNENYLRLKTSSPAIDAGNNDYMDGDPDAYVTGEEVDLLDLAGRSRLAGSKVDLGAYEGAYEFQGLQDQTLTVTTADTDLSMLPAADGNFVATIIVGGSATGWTATASESFITLSSETGTGSGSLTITYSANTMSDARTATVTIATTGRGGHSYAGSRSYTAGKSPTRCI